MDGEGVKAAFCVLLWRSNGGPVDDNGDAICLGDSGVRGNCTRPYDCASCKVMQGELAHYPTGDVTWVCTECTSALLKSARERQIAVRVPGYFTEGYCQNPYCWYRQQYGGDTKYSDFLQLFLGYLPHLL